MAPNPRARICFAEEARLATWSVFVEMVRRGGGAYQSARPICARPPITRVIIDWNLQTEMAGGYA